MKLYSIQASNNCRRVLATAQHLGIELEVIEQPMAEMKAPPYLALNPNGKVPTLVDGDLTLWESRAIMQYVASKKPSALWPTDEKRRADIARWQFWEASHLSPGTGAYAFENLFKKIFMKQDADPVALAVGAKVWNASAPILNGQLEGKKWLLGDELTLADFSLGACFSYAEPSGLPWNDYPHIKAWISRLGEVPAWKNTAPKLG
jgi:glutathione S-transferase